MRHRSKRIVIYCLLSTTVAAALATSATADDEPSVRLPLRRVVMFSSGVAFFERRGEVEGNATAELQFAVDDVNDLLKSMVLQDAGGGRIAPVTYASKDPVSKTLKTFAIDLTSNPSLGDLLDQIRGERVEIESSNRINGVIIGVETRTERVGDDKVVEVEYLNLLTEEGLRSFPLHSVARIKLANEELDAELRQALTVLASAHATDKKSVKLQFLGEGSRPVRVGYIQEMPIWKTSYRLVLGDDEAPFLQGWAIVENTSEDDWSDVELTLVSGRPISFIMNLYDPLYVGRPLVEPDLFASLRPPTYEQDVAAAPPAAPGARGPELKEQAGRMRRGGGGFGGGGVGAGAPADGAPMEGVGVNSDAGIVGGFDVQQGVQSLADAGDVGELFQYAIDTPVTLPRQKSAMLPIVNASVEGEKVSIYDESVQAKHPLNGLELTNSTALHLMQGPITVFDGGAYAGDARIEDLAPGAKRLISYAVDLDTEVSPEQKSQPQELTTVKIAKGVATATYRQQRVKKYMVKNSGKNQKKVLIAYPRDADWKLISPEDPAETTRSHYRFAVTAEPFEPTELAVEEERTFSSFVALTDIDDQTVAYFLRATKVSDEVKAALQEVMKRKLELSKISTERRQREGEIDAITSEQERIRKNLGPIERNSDLYNRYIKKLTDQEAQIEKLREEVAELTKNETQQRQDLNDYIAGLDLE